jgi:hypothetical protein|tara:strand:- start:8449 stop:8652 length:204 start_codon:yes stop_codon:yes gene_type:complete
MTIEKLSDVITRDWYEHQGVWSFSMSELNGIGIDVSSEKEAVQICVQIKAMVFEKMYKLITKEIYKK